MNNKDDGKSLCIDCKERKPLSEFHKNRTRAKGVQARCKPCSLWNAEKWRAEHPDYAAQRSAGGYFKAYRWVRMVERYGLTKERFDEIEAEQGGVCAICRKPAKLVVDHCHDTGIVRGLLCTNCNTGLRYIETSPGWFEAARAYLSRERV